MCSPIFGIQILFDGFDVEASVDLVEVDDRDEGELVDSLDQLDGFFLFGTGDDHVDHQIPPPREGATAFDDGAGVRKGADENDW